MTGPRFMKRDIIDARIILDINDRKGNRSVSVTRFVMRSYVKPFQVRNNPVQQVFIANELIHMSF